MTATEIHKTYRKIVKLLLLRKLKESFDLTSILIDKLNSQPHKLQFENLTTHYKYMLQYFMDGTPDPERSSIHNKLIASSFELASELRDELLSIESSNFEFTQKRYFPHRRQYTPNEIEKKINKDLLLNEIQAAGVSNIDQVAEIQKEYEAVSQYLFQYFWLKSNYDSPQMIGIFNQIMSNESKDSILKSLLITALTLSLCRTFNEQKVLMLFDCVKLDDIHAKQRALVGVSIILARHNRFLNYFPKIRNRLVLLMDSSSNTESLKNILLQIISTTETDEITKRMHEEIFPELMKLRPLMEKGLTDENLFGTDEWGEANPEWKEMIEESGAADIIHEFAELEMSGADVYMSTFSMLKSFPFFNEVSNWFLPFDTSNSYISPLFNDSDNSMIATFANSGAMCNSDRYSFCLSIMQMPESQRNMMKHSFGDAAEQLEEASKDLAMIEPQKRAEMISKHYIQDLFRFFKLFPKKGDFSNPFKSALLLHKTQLFEHLAGEMSIKNIVAEFYFSKKLYIQALELYTEIEKEEKVTAELFQKMGYAYQQTSQINAALNAYKKSDLIKPDDFWTNRKIALCYRLLDDNENALSAYRHADHIKPGNLSVRLQIVNSLAALKRFEEALNNLKTLNEEHSDNPRLLRATMRTALAAKNIAQADYYSSILVDSEKATASDFIITGFIAWIMNKNKEAKTLFIKALQSLEYSNEKFIDQLNAEKELAQQNGISDIDIQLITDAVLYSLED